MQSLLDKSLLRQEETAGEPRFSMLETLREYGLEQLAASGELTEVCRRHATYFMALAETAEPLLKTVAQAAWAARLEAERANLRAAMTWALEHDEPEIALRIAAALAWYWHSRSVAAEGRRILDEALVRTVGRGPTHLRARALWGAGILA